MSSNITLAITGASGASYALRLLQHLIQARKNIHLMVSKPGQIVLGMESDLHLSAQPAKMEKQLTEHFHANEGQLRVYGKDQWTAPIASGSGVSDIMVVCPCTTGTLAAIANGHSRDLLERAADVTIKEHKKLILVVRETPLSAIHLEHMLKLARLGIVIMPASPGFYHGASHTDDLVNFMVSRILDHIGIENDLIPRWGQAES
ncbi:MAG: UbiX family flavin prenyltransferase [Gammaproteobacteria bacterium]|nr:MAG: UbiX family flavin prenyltransferase [Gammaproteobacteria bacterium]